MGPDRLPLATIAPAADAAHVIAFCAKVVPGQAPVRVNCEPDISAPMNECFTVVNAHVAAHGGEMVIGWAIWELPRVYIEAELHAVWRTPSGELKDVAPRPANFTAILFLADPARTDDGRTVDNARMALTTDNDVKRFLFLCSQQYGILNAGERAAQREVSLGRREMKALQNIQKEMTKLSNRLAKRYLASRH